MTIETLPRTAVREMGHATGGSSLAGWAHDDSESNLELQWPLSIGVYNAMRRDAQVAEVLAAVTLPIRSTRWRLDPNGADDALVLQLSEDLDLPIVGDDDDRPRPRQRNRFSWEDHLRLALLEVLFGHMPFEIVVDKEQLLATGKARLRKLAPRMPNTIDEINVERDGGLQSIRQSPAGLMGLQVGNISLREPLIPVEKLVWYSHSREGGAWQGQSTFRASWLPWKLKQDSIRLHAVTIRRNGMGVPWFEAPPGASQPQIDALALLAEKYRGGETSGLAAAAGARLRLMGVEGTLPDTVGFLRFLNEEIAKPAVAEFLKLGSSESGSRALGTAFIDLFNTNEEALAQHIASTATAHVVEKLVDWNAGETAQAPRIVFDAIDSQEKPTADALVSLITAGAITMDDDMEAFIRDVYRMPPMTGPRPAPVAPPAPPAADPVPAPVAAGARSRTSHRQHVSAAASRRDLSDDEVAAGTDFDTLDAQWRTALEDLVDEWQGVRDEQIAALIVAVRAAAEAGDLDAIAHLAAVEGIGSPVLERSLHELAEIAADEAVLEAARQGVALTVPALDDVFGELSDRAAATDALLARGLAQAAAKQALNRLGMAVDDLIAEVQGHLEALTDAAVREQAGGALTQAQNAGRTTTLASGPGGTWYASELLDSVTCVNCSAVDGAAYATAAEVRAAYPMGGFHNCLGGGRCRGTAVKVFDTETPPTVQ